MKKVLLIAAVALCAMSCGKKACDKCEGECQEAAAVEAVEEAAPVEEVAADSVVVEAADSVVAE